MKGQQFSITGTKATISSPTKTIIKSPNQAKKNSNNVIHSKKQPQTIKK